VRRLALTTCALVLAACGGAEAAPFEVGLFDGSFVSPTPAVRDQAFDQASASGARRLRLPVGWREIAPQRPARAADPADPAYRWQALDAAVGEAARRGFEILLSFDTAPGWAEGRGRPRSAAPGAWKPDPRAVADFATALARRYRYVVRDYQVWNEPNLDRYLAPQWVKRGPHRYSAYAPGRYRALLNAAYAAIKAVDPRNRVITAGTAPYGDPIPGGARIMPARFWRDVTCLRTNLTRKRCPDPPHFDVLAHHPYAIAGPRRHALNRDDVAVPDLGKLARIVDAARRQRTALPRGRKPLWVTEMSWDSNPPDPQGVPARRHAAWLADALYTLWKEHVRTVLWFLVVDQAPVPSYPLTNQSGLYLRDGTPKLAQRAFAFPVACERAGRGRFRVWGMAPVAAARATVQVRRAGRWRAVGTPRAGPDRVFRFRGAGSPRVVRAVQGRAASLGCAPRG
jgi:hypothetical protein